MILFKYATRSRPDLFIRGYRSIVDNILTEDYKILVSVDYDDKYSIKRILDVINEKTIVVIGKSKSKIDAINRDIRLIGKFDVLVNMSDDMVFIKKGFDEVILNNISPFSCLHFPDGNRNDLITLSIIGYDFYKYFNYIYCPEYKSLYCDNEQTEVAKKLGAYKYISEQIFEHLHPAYGKAVFDSQYAHTESFNYIDKQTFEKRKAINYGL